MPTMKMRSSNSRVDGQLAQAIVDSVAIMKNEFSHQWSHIFGNAAPNKIMCTDVLKAYHRPVWLAEKLGSF